MSIKPSGQGLYGRAFNMYAKSSVHLTYHNFLDIDVIVAKSDCFDLTDFVRLGILSLDELQRLGNFKFDEDRAKFACWRILLRQLLGSRLTIDPTIIKFNYGACGKPTISDHYCGKRTYFNVAHAGNIAVFCFSNACDLGIDVELIDPNFRIDEIVKDLFSHNELAAYFALPPEEKVLGFYSCWTRKEAFIKAVGAGLDYPLKSFEVTLSPNDPARVISIGNMVDQKSRWDMWSFSPSANYIACLVSKRDI